MARTRTLMPVRYSDSKRNVYLTNYADMVVYGNGGSAGMGTLYAIRFGGYPEQAEAMAAAIYGGGTAEIEVGERTVMLRALAKRYTKKASHDGVYTEVAMYATECPETVPGNNGRKQEDASQTGGGDIESEDTGHDANADGDSGHGAGGTGAPGEKTAPAEKGSHSDDPPRGVCIYTAPGDSGALYDAIDKAVSVPLIPEFSGWLIEELQRCGYLKPLKVLSASVKMDAWMLKCESRDMNIIAVVEKGLRNRAIAIPGDEHLPAAPSLESSPVAPNFETEDSAITPRPQENGSQAATSQAAIENVGTVTEYLTLFGTAIAERIKTLFTPMFDPERDTLSPEVIAVNEYIREKAGYSLYGAQLAVAEAIKRRLSSHKSGIVVAECGSGKTKIGLAAITAATAGLVADQKRRNKAKTFNIVLCPAHIMEKWVREINESLPDTFAGIASSITGFDRLYSDYEKSGKSCWAVISKENARDGYMRMPAALWNERHKSFVCPDCEAIIMMEIYDGAARYAVPSDQFFFKRENRHNHKCSHCGSMLWTALNPYGEHNWAKIGGYGFVYAPMAQEHLGKTNNPLFEEKLMGAIAGQNKTAGAHRKYPLSTYIRKKYRGRIDGLIADELHDYLNDSGQGDAMSELYGTAKKVIGMTATLINGYASGIFHLLYRLVPGLMERNGQRHNAPRDFAAQYGVIRNTYIQNVDGYSANRRTLKRKTGTKQLPGVSPLVYTRFLLEHAAFLSLADMGKQLPEYVEIPVALDLPQDVKKACDSMRDELTAFMKQNRKVANRILSSYLNLLTAYPDQPYGQPPVVHPLFGYVVIDPPDIGSFETVMPKDKVVLDITDRKIRAGEKLLIYTNWTRLDTQHKLKTLLTEAGYKTEILPATIPPKDRERWVQGKLDDGMQILISNPSLVQTGLDLNAFTTLIFYDTGYKLFTLRQAARRSYRINQTSPRIEVYLLYYRDTMQHKAMKLMGTKLAVASIIEGGFTEEGLAAMSQCEDVTTLMAKELMLGIRDSVDDVSAAFRRMSETRQKQGGVQGQDDMPELVVFTAFGETSGDGGGIVNDLTCTGSIRRAGTVRTVEFTFSAAGTESAAEATAATGIAALLSFETPQMKNKTRIPDGQLTIFDMLGLSA